MNSVTVSDGHIEYVQRLFVNGESVAEADLLLGGLIDACMIDSVLERYSLPKLSAWSKSQMEIFSLFALVKLYLDKLLLSMPYEERLTDEIVDRIPYLPEHIKRAFAFQLFVFMKESLKEKEGCLSADEKLEYLESGGFFKDAHEQWCLYCDAMHFEKPPAIV